MQGPLWAAGCLRGRLHVGIDEGPRFGSVDRHPPVRRAPQVCAQPRTGGLQYEAPGIQALGRQPMALLKHYYYFLI